jgi:hypothetical protein
MNNLVHERIVLKLSDAECHVSEQMAPGIVWHLNAQCYIIGVEFTAATITLEQFRAWVPEEGWSNWELTGGVPRLRERTFR